MDRNSVAYQLAILTDAYHSCLKQGASHADWAHKHLMRINAICGEYMPHGAGLDTGVPLQTALSGTHKLVFHANFHHMDVNGYYDGWSKHVVTVTANLTGLQIKISGRDRNDVKNYIGDVMLQALERTVDHAKIDASMF